MSTQILSKLSSMSEHELRRELTEILTRQRLGLVWEHSAIERDNALNANVVLPQLDHALSHNLGDKPCKNLIIEGDNFDSLRLLRATHANKIRVIYIDPPYNTGNKDWIYNDRYAGQNDKWRHSQWLEFLYQRLTLARDLLTPDGVIMVSINDENRARLELLMDNVFPGRRVGSFVWRSRTGGNDTKGAFFSDNHEHVLVYANPDFRFTGDEKSYSIYKHEEAGRIFYLSDLTKAHDLRERPNTYYPVHDPKNDVWYPCNPSRVWAYASRHRLLPGQKLRGETMEDMVDQGQIWFPPDQRIAMFNSMAALLDAVDAKDIPFSGPTPLLTRDSPDLEQWVGRKIGYGRPRLKKFKDGLKNENSPISSWLTPRTEVSTAEPDQNMPIVGTTEEGSRALKIIMGEKGFPYPKPPSLIRALLAQAARPGDIVLDFFSGSGTTAEVVLELNAEDFGDRTFILCSSTENTTKDPERNLCRDVCAERIRRVMSGYGDTVGLGGAFAYLKLDRIDPADAPLDAGAHQITQLLSLRLQGAAIAPSSYVDPMIVLARSEDVAAIYIPHVTEEAIKAASALPHRRLLVFSARHDTVRELLEAAGKLCDSRAVGNELVAGQAGVSQTDLRVRTNTEDAL